MNINKPIATLLVVASAIPIFAGAYAVLVTSAQYTGLGLVSSYGSFQAGSILGIVISILVWSCATIVCCWSLIRRVAGGNRITALSVSAGALSAYAVPAVFVLYPDTAMGFAVSHVKAFTDETVPHSDIVDLLFRSGLVAAALAAAFAVGSLVHARKTLAENA